MTIKTFWTIFIKVLGIWLILEGFSVIPQALTALPFFGSTFNNDIIIDICMAVIVLLLTVGSYILILWLFVFKTAWLVDKLRLDKGFESERFDFTIQLSAILKVATIVIGGLLFIDSLPQLCRQVFVFYQQKGFFYYENPTIAWIIFYAIQTLIGYLLMINSSSVVKFINKQATNDNENRENESE